MKISEIDSYLWEIGNLLGSKNIKTAKVSIADVSYKKLIKFYKLDTNTISFFSEVNDYGVALEIFSNKKVNYTSIIFKDQLVEINNKVLTKLKDVKIIGPSKSAFNFITQAVKNPESKTVIQLILENRICGIKIKPKQKTIVYANALFILQNNKIIDVFRIKSENSTYEVYKKYRKI